MIINVPVKVAFVRKRKRGGRQVSSNVVHCLSFWEVIVIAWPTLVTTSMNGEPHFCSARCIFHNVVKIYTFSTKYFIHKMSTSLQPQKTPICADKSITNLIGGSLESPYWLLLAFCPKIFGGGGDLGIVFLLKNECRLSGVDNHRWWRHSNLLPGKKI